MNDLQGLRIMRKEARGMRGRKRAENRAHSDPRNRYKNERRRAPTHSLKKLNRNFKYQLPNIKTRDLFSNFVTNKTDRQALCETLDSRLSEA